MTSQRQPEIPAAVPPAASPPDLASSINTTCMQDSLPSDSMRFRILRPHARGGLGEVFVANDTELGREVALKEIQLERSHDAEARTRFIREAEITGGLEHPGVVPVYSLGAYPDGRPFYAMRFIRGQTLHDAIKAFHAPLQAGAKPLSAMQRNLELRKLLQRFIDVCEAIDYAHSRGVLHRDLKPGNIMLGRYGETLVVDWGLAKAGGESTARPQEAMPSSAGNPPQFPEPQLSPSASHESEPTQMGFVPGTPAYMSPEHALGRIDLMGPASDVFSLGATLYHLLTGRPPYVGRDVREVQQLAQTGNFPLPSTIAAVPKPLEAVCCKALAVNPAERYANSSALAADIERYLGDEPVRAWREPLRTRIARWARRNSRLVGIVVICFLIIPICLGSGLFVALQQKQLARTAEDRAEVGLLCASTALAHNALLAGDHPTAARALKRIPLHRRSWVYEYLFRQLAFHGVVEGETGGITCLAVQPASEQLAYGTQSGEVCLRDARSGRETQRKMFSTEPQPVAAIAWSTSSTQLAVASGNVVQIYNATTMTPSQRVPLPAMIAGVAFSPDDRQLLVSLRGDEPRLVALGVADGAIQWSASTARCDHPCLCFASRAQVLLGAGNRISVLEPATGTPQGGWDLESGDEVRSLLGTADGEQVVVGTAQGVAAVYDIASGQLIRRLEKVISSVVGAKLVHNEQGSAAWNDQRAAIVGSMALRDSDNVVLVSSAGDVWIVNYQTGDIRKQLIHKGVQCAGGSSGGPLIAMADLDEVFVFDATHALRELSREVRVFPELASYPALSSDGRLVMFAMQDKNEPATSLIVAHDVDAGAVRWTAQAQFPHYFGSSPDGSLIVALCDDLKVFDSQSGVCLMQSPKLVLPRLETQWPTTIHSAVIAADNRHIAIDGDSLQVWEIATGRKVAETPRLAVSSLQLSAEGDQILGQTEEGIRSWRFPDLAETRRLKGPSTGALLGVTRDGHIVEQQGHRLIARTWPANAPICDFEHDGQAVCVGFHPVVQRIVTGGVDGKLNVWQYPSGEKLLELPFSRTVAAVRFSRDGSRLIAIDRDGKVGIWDSKPHGVASVATQ